jgi:large subunit ribosomal protein L4
MASLPIFDMAGKEVGSYEIEWTDLAPEIKKQLLHDAVVMYQANKRQGSFKTKSRAEVAYSTRKLYRQKGTGNARAGARGSGIRRGGGHIFAKRPRDFSYRLPKKMLRAATRQALASKIRDEEIVVLSELAVDVPRTKVVADMLTALGLAGKTALLVTDEYHVNVYKSGRNIPGVVVSAAAEINALSVLTPQVVVVTKTALDAIRERTANAPREEAAA